MNDYCVKMNFDNGYTASVSCNNISYGGELGLFEVAVMIGHMIVYDTPITNDVVGWLTFDGVSQILKRIEKLPKREQNSHHASLNL